MKGSEMSKGFPILADLMDKIEQRRETPMANSYTSSMLEMGMKAIGSRVMEEASEFVSAAHDLDVPPELQTQESRDQLVSEAADLLFHTMVMLAQFDVGLVDVEVEFKRRLAHG